MQALGNEYPRKKVVKIFSGIGLLETLGMMIYFFDFVRGEVDLGLTILMLSVFGGLSCFAPMLLTGLRIANKRIIILTPKDCLKVLPIVFMCCLIFMLPIMFLFSSRPDIMIKVFFSYLLNSIIVTIFSFFILPKGKT